MSEKLIGKTITRILIHPAGEAIRFETDQGNVDYHAVGDCCSYSWIESFTSIGMILNKKVDRVIELDLPSRGFPCRDESLQVYGWLIQTEVERWGNKCYDQALLEFRNESNGYYGGSLDEGECKVESNWIVGVDDFYSNQPQEDVDEMPKSKV